MNQTMEKPEGVDANKNTRLARLEEIQAKWGDRKGDEFGVTSEELLKICDFDHRTSPALIESLNSYYGGVQGLALLLRSDYQHGLKLKSYGAERDAHHMAININHNVGKVASEGSTIDFTPADVENRKKVFGENIIQAPPSPSIWELVWDTIKSDTIIQILLIGSAIVLVLGTIECPKEGWVEGFAIFVAVAVVLSVTAGNDWSKERKFRRLLLMQSDKKTKVIRAGIKNQISSWDVVVGDLVEVLVGDEIIADGVLVLGNRLVVDESPLTGESIPVKKGPSAPFMFSGCQVSEGSGLMLVTAVGSHSSGGRIQEILNSRENEQTPLQKKLQTLAVLIGKAGVAAAVLTFLGLIIRWGISWAKNETPHLNDCVKVEKVDTILRLQSLAQIFVIGVTIVVVAVPEGRSTAHMKFQSSSRVLISDLIFPACAGLPLAVTISLAFSMFKMIKDNCFVRHLDASETMGEATCCCTDKTGTLTENRMKVVKCYMASRIHHGEGSGETNAKPFETSTYGKEMRDLITEAIAVNSTCFVKYRESDSQPIFVGSATEGALLVWCKQLGGNYEEVREHVRPVENGVWSFTSGASEIVVGICTHMVAGQNEVTALSNEERKRILDTITAWASEGLRTLAIAYRATDTPPMETDQRQDESPEYDLTFLCLVGIKDPLRPGVDQAVAACQKAGLTIRMVTGDNILTACKIAKECGILTDGGVAMEGPQFRALSDEARRAAIPTLQVLARSSPADKHILVSLLKNMGEVVAVTGDGTNDAPALKVADVGFAMGISGTQIAINASDIVLLDDNFVTLVQSIRWGRNVLDSVRKFLQFQLGVNAVAIILTFIGSVSIGSSPLSTVQLLWVNLIMDSMGALALASDDPDEDILTHPPHGRSEPLLSPDMQRYMGMQVVYQTISLLTILFKIHDLLPADPSFHSISHTEGETDSKRTHTFVFTTFVLLQVVNMTMARQLYGEVNVFRGIFRNKYFLILMAIIVAVQFLVVTFAGNFVNTIPLEWKEWVAATLVALGNMPFTIIVRYALKTLLPQLTTEPRAQQQHQKRDQRREMMQVTEHEVTLTRGVKAQTTSKDETGPIPTPIIKVESTPNLNPSTNLKSTDPDLLRRASEGGRDSLTIPTIQSNQTGGTAETVCGHSYANQTAVIIESSEITAATFVGTARSSLMMEHEGASPQPAHAKRGPTQVSRRSPSYVMTVPLHMWNRILSVVQFAVRLTIARRSGFRRSSSRMIPTKAGGR
ncbi:Calcium-transporting ATPase 10, plasma membrane-type [Quaeritorhiza haematococci]|nr:Calcium-transporting ATPase 10, plasma membrane-type [Quaeritorhiza haematococci]